MYFCLDGHTILRDSPKQNQASWNTHIAHEAEYRCAQLLRWMQWLTLGKLPDGIFAPDARCVEPRGSTVPDSGRLTS